MKKVLIVFSIAAALFSTMSCQTEKEPATPAANHELSLSAQSAGSTLPSLNTYDLKGGQQRTVDLLTTLKEQGSYDIKVTYGVDESLVAEFNTTNSTSYTLLPSTAYSIEPAQVQFEKYNKYSPFSVLTITAPELEVAASYLLPVVISKVETTDKYTVNPEAAAVFFVINVEATDPNGAGTLDRPYKLRTAADLVAIEDKLVEGTEIFFAMENDIDMTEVTEWTPINLDGLYKFNFDGKGHKISNFKCEGKSNASFFGILNGTVKNVTFENAAVVSTGTTTAILAAYASKGDGTATINNVKIYNSTVGIPAAAGKSTNFVGILCAEVETADINGVYIENCGVTGEGKPRFFGYIGGINDAEQESFSIRNVWVKGGSISINQEGGGIFGRIESLKDGKNVVIENCGVSCELIDDNQALGGIVGRIDACDNDIKVANCVVWSPSIIDEGSNSRSSGIVVGIAQGTKMTLQNCVYRSDINFSDVNYAEKFVATTPDVVNGQIGDAGDFSPYHGAPTTASTASAAAKALGWDETIWDLSSDEPKLK